MHEEGLEAPEDLTRRWFYLSFRKSFWRSLEERPGKEKTRGQDRSQEALQYQVRDGDGPIQMNT